MQHVAMVGYGAIGSHLMRMFAADARVRLDQVIVGATGLKKAQAALGDGVAIVTRLEDLPRRPDVLIECASHRALTEHVVPALASGIDSIILSIGALANDGMAELLAEAANAGSSRLKLVSGAIGAIDALAAAQLGGLDEVVYVGSKPPSSWRGSPGESVVCLDSLAEATTLFKGSARDAARLYPKNANVAAALALAGLGLDATQVRLVADPSLSHNVHSYTAQGRFGRMSFTIEGMALPDNPKTSALTACSLARALINRVEPMGF
ncbi:aspartate dehydrogenase [Polaromonas eurypsychrophila]|uniref:L-aspartate dehydrogenase n=1 Tax=Polaromonas eurypsychrophila TaxID=1614635 RepID=A0A916WML5_9BURK|nr:aspartate dehydrogenase [Polaromonas eurypsychrophila]GGB12442.1 putative L-aspartate dehydrogenase [Polaromonas eurypsychrophila]